MSDEKVLPADLADGFFSGVTGGVVATRSLLLL